MTGYARSILGPRPTAAAFCATTACLLAFVGVGSSASATSNRAAAQDWLYSCGGPPYPLAIFSEPMGAEAAQNPAARALRKMIRHPSGIETLPVHGWRKVPRVGRVQSFVARKPGAPKGLFEIVFRRSSSGSWRYQYSSHFCQIGPQLDDRAVDHWKLDSDFPPPGPNDTTIHALVEGSYCNSGEPPKLTDSLISSGSRRLVISPVEEPPRGFQSCLGSPPAKYTFDLGEPIGERVVMDAHVFPFKKRLDLRR